MLNYKDTGTDGEYRYRDISTTVPTVIGFEGIRKSKELELAPEEKEGLEKSVHTLSPYMRLVEQYPGILSVR
jgi:malate/lactate dehydrogenase